jgi:hypothetical protein
VLRSKIGNSANTAPDVFGGLRATEPLRGIPCRDPENCSSVASKYIRLAKAQVDPSRATGKTRHYRGGELLPLPRSLEIVQVPPDTGYYLLYIDERGAEVSDTWHESLDRAMEQANYEFGLLAREWDREASS